MFDPKTNKYPYPLDTCEHYLKVKKDRKIIFDEKYPYIDKSKGFLFKQKLIRILLCLIVFPITRIRLGLKIKGESILKENKELLKGGVVSCSNHVHMWDYLAIMLTLRSRHTNVLSWDKNINGENGTLIRLVGGIPIPSNSISGSKKYVSEVGKLLDDKGWLHIYPEGSMWEYYAPIRPFLKGTAYFACKFNKPILPIGISYREPNWIRKHIFGQIACFTINIGKPIIPGSEDSFSKSVSDLTVKCHDEICTLVGINPKDNIYDALYDNSKRIDYYTSEYGIGYKGSH